MTEERKILLNKINKLINKKRIDLLNQFPVIHELEDGFIVRFFTLWNDCANGIKYRKIDCENPNEIAYFLFIPKDVFFNITKNLCAESVTCLSGELEFDIDGKTRYLNSYSRININTQEFCGKALKDSYVSTTNIF